MDLVPATGMHRRRRHRTTGRGDGMRKRSRIDRTLRLLILLNIVVVALLAGTMVLDWMKVIPARGTAEESRRRRPSATPETMQMGLAHIPTSNSCLLCHEKGGAADLKPIPAIGHQLEGWTACLTCHTDETLGRKAPGHAGIAESECLNCHKVARGRSGDHAGPRGPRRALPRLPRHRRAPAVEHGRAQPGRVLAVPQAEPGAAARQAAPGSRRT